MTTFLVTEGHPDDAAALFTLATYDVDAAVVRMAPSEGQHGITRIIHTLLETTGTAQATVGPQRASERGDIGRAQVALTRARMDVVIFGGQRLVPDRDVRALTGAVAAAGRDLYLVDIGVNGRSARGGVFGTADLGIEETELLEVIATFQTRAGKGGRREPWPCDMVLQTGTGTAAAAGCERHFDAVGCVLAWSGHAYATARATREAISCRFHELTRTAEEHRRWAVLARARDPWKHACQAASAAGLTADAQDGVRICDLANDGSTVRLAQGPLTVPGHLRAVLVAHRDIRRADGWQDGDPLLEVSVPPARWRR